MSGRRKEAHDVTISKADELCGIGRCTPRRTQSLANLQLFAITYGVAGIWMATLPSLLASQVTSIERHLGLTTTNAGMLLSANDVGYLLAVMIGSHIGRYLHIPRTLSLSAIAFGAICSAMALGRLADVKAESVTGHNTSESSDPSTSQQPYLCNIANGSDTMPSKWDSGVVNISHSAGNLTSSGISSVDSTSSSTFAGLPWAFWLMLVLAAAGGVAKSYRIPLFTQYIEDNVKDDSSSAFLIGTSFTAMVFGPPIALLLGSYISSLHVDFKETTMSQHDPRWVGAWWLGFLVVGLACIVSALPVMLFPRRMPRRGSDNEEDEMESKRALELEEAQHEATTKAKQIASDLPVSLMRIFRRPIYVLTLVCGSIEVVAVYGAYAFIQKYIENQYNKTPQEVSMTLGILIIFSLAIGTFLGGVLTTKFKLGLRGCTIATVIRACLLFAGQWLYFVFGCSNSDFVGVIAETDNCQCDKSSILLVCGDDNINYLSPCFAGCVNVTDGLFTNCSAVSGGQWARPGQCDDGCSYYTHFIATYFVLVFISSMSIVPGFIMAVRSVEKKDQSLAMGTRLFVETIFGTLPSPVLFGKVIDSTCLIWQPGGGYCMLQDRDAFRFRFFGLGQILRVVNIAFLCVLLWKVLTTKPNPTTTFSVKRKPEDEDDDNR